MAEVRHRRVAATDEEIALSCTEFHNLRKMQGKPFLKTTKKWHAKNPFELSLKHTSLAHKKKTQTTQKMTQVYVLSHFLYSEVGGLLYLRLC